MAPLKCQQNLIGVLCTFGAGNVLASSVVNGDFATGDLTGWMVPAFDEFDTPLSPSPFIFVTDVGGNNVAEFKTGQFADGLFIATLEQSFPIIAAEPILGFDFSLPTTQIDPTGTGSSPFFDAITVSLDNRMQEADELRNDWDDCVIPIDIRFKKRKTYHDKHTVSHDCHR